MPFCLKKRKFRIENSIFFNNNFLRQNMDKYNFHSHTYRCGHAEGTEEEYILKAIEEGFKYYGVSDHVMFPFINQPGIRGDYDINFQPYITAVNDLKIKYKNDIDLHIGMEVEYSPLLDNYYRDLLKNELDYLIMGQHFHMENNMQFYNYDRYSDGVDLYVDDMILGMESGLILYVAHPDQFVYYYDKRDERLIKICERVVKAAKRTDTPLELNISKVEFLRWQGSKNPEQEASFPLDMFWRIVGKEHAKVVIGLDSHHPRFVSTAGFNYALELVNRYNLNVLDAKEIIKRMDKIKKAIG